MNPSLALLPCAYDAGKLYSVLPDTGAGDFTVSRNGTATFLGSNGLIQTAQANEPRLEFNTDGSFRGVLVEPAATNLLLRSQEFENQSWIAINTTVTQNIFIAPNGTLTADRISISDATSRVSQTLSLGAGTFTFSVYIYSGVSFTLRLVASVDGANVSRNITVSAGQWTRFAQTFTSTTSLSNVQIRGIVSNGDIFIWGAQLELGSVATSYIPTVASTVTRPADLITVTVPSGVTEIKETVNGVETTITSIPTTYQLPNGNISRVLME
jgi:hypothetical protein